MGYNDILSELEGRVFFDYFHFFRFCPAPHRDRGICASSCLSFCDPSFFCHNGQLGYQQLDAILILGALSVDTIHRVNLIRTLVLPGASTLPLELLLPAL